MRTVVKKGGVREDYLRVLKASSRKALHAERMSDHEVGRSAQTD